MAHTRRTPDQAVPRRRGRWSATERLEVLERYAEVGEARLARRLRRSAGSVHTGATRLFGALPARTGHWRQDEVQQLRLLVGAHSISHIALVLRRTVEDVRQKIGGLRAMCRAGPWTRGEILLLKRLFGSRDDRVLAVAIGRPADAVAAKAAELCLRKDKAFLARRGASRTLMPRWQRAELSVLRRLYRDHDNMAIARRLHRSVKSVVSKAHVLGLAKSHARLVAMGRTNVAQRWGMPPRAAGAHRPAPRGAPHGTGS